jgi:hypothetical protein
MFFAVFAFFAFFVIGATGADARIDPRTIVDLERALQSDPENLVLAADYRQLADRRARLRSADSTCSRSWRSRKDSGPNVQISLALAVRRQGADVRRHPASLPRSRRDRRADRGHRATADAAGRTTCVA